MVYLSILTTHLLELLLIVLSHACVAGKVFVKSRYINTCYQIYRTGNYYYSAHTVTKTPLQSVKWQIMILSSVLLKVMVKYT